MRVAPAAGFTLVEQLLVVAILAVLFGMAVPATGNALDELRTSSAARYLAARIVQNRMDAIKRSRQVALRFADSGGDYSYQAVIDGNRNGVRTAEISRGIDRALHTPERIGDNFRGVRLELGAGLPDADGTANTGTDGVRLGSGKILTMSPDGTATAGTLYVRGHRAQYAVRVLGVTGRVRVMQYREGERKWINR